MTLLTSPFAGLAAARLSPPFSTLSPADKKLAQRLRLLGAPLPLSRLARIIPGWAPTDLATAQDGNAELIDIDAFDAPDWRCRLRPVQLDLPPDALIWRRPHVLLRPVPGGWQARVLEVRPLVPVAVAPLVMIAVTDPHFLIPDWLAWYIGQANDAGRLPHDAAGWADWEVLRPGYKVQLRRLVQNRRLR